MVLAGVPVREDPSTMGAGPRRDRCRHLCRLGDHRHLRAVVDRPDHRWVGHGVRRGELAAVRGLPRFAVDRCDDHLGDCCLRVAEPDGRDRAAARGRHATSVATRGDRLVVRPDCELLHPVPDRARCLPSSRDSDPAPRRWGHPRVVALVHRRRLGLAGCRDRGVRSHNHRRGPQQRGDRDCHGCRGRGWRAPLWPDYRRVRIPSHRTGCIAQPPSPGRRLAGPRGGVADTGIGNDTPLHRTTVGPGAGRRSCGRIGPGRTDRLLLTVRTASSCAYSLLWRMRHGLGDGPRIVVRDRSPDLAT